MNFYDEFTRLCKVRSTTIDAVMKRIGKTSAVYFGWRARDMVPRADDLYEICKVLEVSMEHFFEDDNLCLVPPKYKKIVSMLENLSADDFEAVNSMTEEQLKNFLTLCKSMKV